MKKLFFLIIIVILLISVVPATIFSFFRDQGRQVTSPLMRPFYSFGQRILYPFDWIKNINNIREENTDLKVRISELSNQVIQLEDLKKENDNLRSELKLRPDVPGFKRIIAKVISHTSPGNRQMVIVNQGSKTGVQVGDAVISNGALAGKVIEVLPHTATVLLVSSNNSIIQAKLSQTGDKGIASGRLSGIYLTDMPPDIKVDKGMIVETSGLGGRMPANILIGETTDQKSSKTESNAYVRLRSPVDFVNLDIVFVLIPQQ